MSVGLGIVMKLGCRSAQVLLLFCVVLAAFGQSAPPPPSKQPPLSKETRLQLIRTFTDELVYIRTTFPMGKKGLSLKDGVITPSRDQVQQMIAMFGPSVKAGDQARLTAVVVHDDHIRFEINGGPVKKPKWYEHLQVGVGGTGPVTPSDQNANPRGSYVDLVFDHYVPDLDPQQLKTLLRPVFDFEAKSALEAFLDTVPPKVKQAIQNHQVLVGMTREMVIYSKGRAPKKIREKDGETEYEDWIYGEPPQDVDFVRVVGDAVVRVETMKIDGTRIVRNEKEVDLSNATSVAKAQEQRPANAPTLRRPGEEETDTPKPSGNNVPMVPPPFRSQSNPGS
jgi:hypothetical protein